MVLGMSDSNCTVTDPLLIVVAFHLHLDFSLILAITRHFTYSRQPVSLEVKFYIRGYCELTRQFCC